MSLAIIALFGVMVASATSVRDNVREYTEEHPLVYEDSWDMYPYAFLNEKGQPDGYNVEVVRMILKELHIPYEIVLKPVVKNKSDLDEGKADLIIVRSTGFFNRFGYYSRNSLSLITMSMATPIGKPVNIKTFSDLGKNQVTVLDSGMVHRLMIDYDWSDNAIPVKDINDAILKVSDTEQGQVIWYKPSLEYLQRTYKLDNLQLTAVDMPLGEARFISHNQQLLNEIDSVYTLLNSEDRFEPLQNKWFYPDRGEWQVPTVVWWVLGVAAMLTLLLLYNLYMFRRKGKRLTKSYEQQNKRLALILEASNVRMWTYDVKTQLFHWYDRDGNNDITHPVDEFSHRYYPGDFNRLSRAIDQLVESDKDQQISLDIKALDSEIGDEQEHDFQMQLSVLQRDKKGKATIILGTKKDITEERRMEQEAEEKLVRYRSVFESPLLGVMVFGEDGLLTNINWKACEILQCDKKEIVEMKPSYRTIFDLQHTAIKELDELTMCRRINFDDVSVMGSLASVIHRRGLQIFEIKMMVVTDEDDGHATCLLVTINDIQRDIIENKLLTTERQDQALLQQQLNNYIDRTNYLFRVTGIRAVAYSMQTHTLRVMDRIDHIQHELTQTRCMTLIHERSQKRVLHLLSKMDNGSQEAFSAEIMSDIRIGDNPLWLMFHMSPTKDEQGDTNGYYGICYDITELKATEQQLEQANATAHEIEHAKTSFLQNMCYEIRTPLTAVVGFADLLSTDITADDERVFTKEILTNSDHLLRLIDEILFYSRIDSHMVEINPAPCEFVELFDAQCQKGWNMVRPDNVEFIVENPYQEIMLNIDATNMGHLITSMVSNAAFATKQGAVRARFDYIAHRLIIAVEDTGMGLNEEDIQHIQHHEGGVVDERIGISLPICKQLAEMMGGTIDISSLAGQGTSVWVSIPCEATYIKRKKYI